MLRLTRLPKNSLSKGCKRISEVDKWVECTIRYELSRYVGLWHVVKSTSWRSMYMFGRFIITLYRCVCELSVCVRWSLDLKLRPRACKCAMSSPRSVRSYFWSFWKSECRRLQYFCTKSQISLTSKTCDWSDFRIKLATLCICPTRKSWSGRRETHWPWASVTSSTTTSSSPPPFKRNITGEQQQQLAS